jgi:hypothetical protein
VSEHIACKIFSELGVEAQTTFLAYYGGEEAVFVKDFVKEGERLVEFMATGNSHTYSGEEPKIYEFKDIEYFLKKNRKSVNVQEVIDRFWRMFVIDALIANFDRHGYNWGFIKDSRDVYRIAPVYDCGSSLFARLLDYNLDPKDIKDRVYNFPTSQIRHKGKKASYYEIINSREFGGCNNAVDYVRDRIDLKRINSIIDNALFCTEERKIFLKKMVHLRYLCILEGRPSDAVPWSNC